jgi:hypothetical protein
MVALTGIEWVSVPFSWVQFSLSRGSSVLPVRGGSRKCRSGSPACQRGGSARDALILRLPPKCSAKVAPESTSPHSTQSVSCSEVL